MTVLAVIAGLIDHPPVVQIDAGGLADWVSGLGSLAAVVVALRGFQIVADQRAADRRNAERGVAFELAATILDVGNNLRAFEQHCREQRNDVTIKKSGEIVAQFRVLNPLIGLSTEGEMQLPAGSTELLFKAGAIELWNEARLLANRNRALTSLFKEYQSVWHRAIDKMPASESLAETVARMSPDEEAFRSMRDDLNRIDSMVAALEDQVKDTGAILTRVSSQIGPVMKAYFEEPFLDFGGASQAGDPQTGTP